ncbi:M23 family peptidase, partial [Acinetobacter baumannii]
MRRFVYNLSLVFLIIILAACASAPKKPAPLSPAQVSKLNSMQLPSRLPVPVKGVDRDEIKDTWGAARSQGRSHEGIDILAPRGTKVYSAT